LSLEEGSFQEEANAEPITKDELAEAGLSASQLAQKQLNKQRQNIISGYKVSKETFAEILTAALPKGAGLSEEVKVLQNQALVDLGFSVSEDSRFSEAEKVFQALIQRYPDAESTPIVYLEYARILSEQGRLDAAQSLISEAMDKYGSDKDFFNLAKNLKEAISDNE